MKLPYYGITTSKLVLSGSFNWKFWGLNLGYSACDADALPLSLSFSCTVISN